MGRAIRHEPSSSFITWPASRRRCFWIFLDSIETSAWAGCQEKTVGRVDVGDLSIALRQCAACPAQDEARSGEITTLDSDQHARAACESDLPRRSAVARLN